MRIQFLHSQKWQKRHLLSPSNAAPQLKTLPKNISHSPKTPKESHSPQIPLLASISDHKQLSLPQTKYLPHGKKNSPFQSKSTLKNISSRQKKLSPVAMYHPKKKKWISAAESLPVTSLQCQKPLLFRKMILSKRNVSLSNERHSPQKPVTRTLTPALACSPSEKPLPKISPPRQKSSL